MIPKLSALSFQHSASASFGWLLNADRRQLLYSSSVNVTFSTSRKFSSTGVERPKIVTTTLSVDLSEFTSSTLPVKDANGPDFILTVSPDVYVNFGFGFSAASVTLWTIWFTSSGVSGVR